MKRIRNLLIASFALGIFALAGAWWAVCAYADLKAKQELSNSRDAFVQRIENTLDGVLWYAAELAADMLDHEAKPREEAEMRKIADTLGLDELTVVGTNGIAVASNFKEFVNFDWHTTPETMAFVELLSPSNPMTKLTQPFRQCVIRHNHYLKFGAIVFPGRSGIVQVGYSMERLVNTLACSDAKAFGSWTFGRYGRFGAVDRNSDKIPDPVPQQIAAAWPMGRIRKIAGADGVWTRMTFPFAGHLFYAEVPEREFGDERNAAFLLAAAVIVALLSVFVTLLVRLRLSSLRLEKLHSEATVRAAEDLRLAHTIQMSTLPRASVFNPECLAYDLEALMLPAREVGGDLYDFFVLADGRIAFVIGDASGKGVPAAMFMLVAKNAIRQALHGQGDPCEAMSAANAALCADNEAQMFVTMVLGVLDPVSGTITYVNAGHTRPYVIRHDGSVERLELRGGRLLGLFSDLSFCSGTVRLMPGDRIFLYTDGVTEALDAQRRLYGAERLKSMLEKNSDDVCNAVRSDVAEHVNGAAASDDLTMLVLSWWGEPVRVERKFAADASSLRPAIEFLRESCHLENKKKLMRLLQVVDESVSNIVNHSGAREFTMEISSVKDRCRVVLTDDGREYNPLAHNAPDIHARIEERPVGGLGILLAKGCADFISWRREGGFNRLTVVQNTRIS